MKAGAAQANAEATQRRFAEQTRRAEAAEAEFARLGAKLGGGGD